MVSLRVLWLDVGEQATGRARRLAFGRSVSVAQRAAPVNSRFRKPGFKARE